MSDFSLSNSMINNIVGSKAGDEKFSAVKQELEKSLSSEKITEKDFNSLKEKYIGSNDSSKANTKIEGNFFKNMENIVNESTLDKSKESKGSPVEITFTPKEIN